MPSTWWLIAVALGASAVGGTLGMAGGIFIVPVLTIFGHVEIHTAIAASIVSVIVCSSASAAPLLQHRLTDIRLAIFLETATTLGALTGVLLVGIIPTRDLSVLFAAILVISAQQMFARRVSSPRPPRVKLGWTLMYGAGLVSALLGIGSGVLKIPAMDTALSLPLKISSATSNFMIGVTAAASAGAYFMRGDIHPAIAGPVALGSVIGSIAGAHILLVVSSAKLRVLFVLVLLALAGGMLRSAW
jgi:uncharacterized protein